MKKEVINSPIRWAGSKKKLLNEMLSVFDKSKEIYVEPFLGSGVVLINLLNNIDEFSYKKFYVNDINENIINFYNLLRNEYKYVKIQMNKLIKKYNYLSNIKLKEDFYYEIRNKYNTSKNSNIKAIYFLFLMKTGFNGVYRENSKGCFNVPFGRKEIVRMDMNYLKELSNKISNVEFYNMDYSEFLDMLNKKKVLDKAFIYFDPPYLPEESSINQKQSLYTNQEFKHIDFFKYISKLKKAKYTVSMINSKSANQIYGKLYKYMVADIVRTINPKKIFKSTEVIFSNFKI